MKSSQAVAIAVLTIWSCKLGSVTPVATDMVRVHGSSSMSAGVSAGPSISSVTARSVESSSVEWASLQESALKSATVFQTPVRGELFTRTADGVIRAAIRIQIDPKWYIYHSDLGSPNAVGQPTTVIFYTEGIVWSEVRFPEPIRLDQSDIAGDGAFILAHEKEVVLYAAGKIAPDASGDDLKVRIKGLACEDVQGYFPFRQDLTSKGTGDDALFVHFPTIELPTQEVPKLARIAIPALASTLPNDHRFGANDVASHAARTNDLGTLRLDSGGVCFVNTKASLTIPLNSLICARTRVEAGTRQWIFIYEDALDWGDDILIVTYGENRDLTSRLKSIIVELTEFEEVGSQQSLQLECQLRAPIHGSKAADPSGPTGTDASPTSNANKQFAEAYDRRRYKLGMTITEFKALPYPDEDTWPGARPYFSTDEGINDDWRFTDVRMYDEDWAKAGVVRCVFFYESKSFPGLELKKAGLRLAGEPADTEFYFIAEEINSEPRLFLIETPGPTGRYEELKRIYTTSFGKKPSIDLESVQNGWGARFENEICTWSNEISMVTLSRYAGDIDTLEIRHVLTPFQAVLLSRLNSSEVEKAKGL